MNILHVCASDISGGASRAAYRIHRSLVQHGEAKELQSRLRVIQKLSDDPTVIGGPPVAERGFWQGRIGRRILPRLKQKSCREFRTGNPELHSTAWPATGMGQELLNWHRRGEADVVHLHWLGDATLSIEEIGRLPMPLVWTLHDQWPFCGAEHYTSPPKEGETASTDERFVLGYTAASRPDHETGPDLNRLTWQRKRMAWRRPIHIVATTTWLADCARRSALMGSWPISVIPYPLDLNSWAPFDQRQARALLQLPQDRPLVLFGAIRGTNDPRKGADLLLEALLRLQPLIQGTSLENMELVVFGQSPPAEPPKLGFPIHYRGRLQDDLSLRLHYAAADVMVVPSRQEAFGQTASEAQACGTPVVCFRTGGLTDVVEHGYTGLCVNPFDPISLSEGIKLICEKQELCVSMGVAARERATKLWDPKRISSLYRELYARELAWGN